MKTMMNYIFILYYIVFGGIVIMMMELKNIIRVLMRCLNFLKQILKAIV